MAWGIGRASAFEFTLPPREGRVERPIRGGRMVSIGSERAVGEG